MRDLDILHGHPKRALVREELARVWDGLLHSGAAHQHGPCEAFGRLTVLLLGVNASEVDATEEGRTDG